MSEELGRKRLDRRGFLGAAAGVAAAGAGALTWTGKSQALGPDCSEVLAEIPKIRRGMIHYTLPAQAWNTTALFRDFITFADGLNDNAWEFAGSYPTVLPNGVNGSNGTATPQGLSGWVALGSYAKRYGFRVVGTHDGPAPTSAANLGSAILKMNAWHCNQLGAGSGFPGGNVNLPGAGTAITQASAISAWQASCATMNSWGQAYQTNSGAGVIGSTPYGPGVFAGTALTAGRSCARYYRHFHSEQGKWIQNTGTKYDNHYISELVYTELDFKVSYAQSDQCWLLDGLWMAGGNAPSVGIQGAGEPNPGQGRNRLVHPDIVERFQDKIGTFHIKDLGSGTAINDQGTSVTNIGDNAGPGSATGNYPFDTHAPAYGAVPWDPAQDTVPYSEIFPRLRHPERHEFLFERDGMSNTVTSNAYWRKLMVQSFDMFDKILLDRGPDAVRLPYAIPSTQAEWQSTGWLPYSQQRPPTSGAGAPGPECPPEVNGRTRVGDRLNVSFRGTWARFNENDATKYEYLWLRDGAPIQALYDGAPLGDPPCNSAGERSYEIRTDDVGHRLSCQVTALGEDGNDAATSVITNAVTVAGYYNAAADADLGKLRDSIVAMNLADKPELRLTSKIDSIRHWLSFGDNVCDDIDALRGIVDDLNTYNKLTDAQAASINSQLDDITGSGPRINGPSGSLQDGLC